MGRNRKLCPWAPEAEEVAMEWIQEGSKKTFLGQACSCYPKCCYHRQCILRIYFMALIFLVVAAGVIGWQVPSYIESQNSLVKTEMTQCQTEYSKFTGVELSCNACSSKNRNSCNEKRVYPCLLLWVSYKTDDNHYSYKQLSYTIEEAKTDQFCMEYTKDCVNYNPTDKINGIYKTIGQNGSSFNCFYNPDDPEQIVLEQQEVSSFPIIVPAIFGSFAVLLLIMAFIAFLICGCKHLYGCSPTPEVQAEVTKRTQQRQQEMGQMAAQQAGQFQGLPPGQFQAPPPGQFQAQPPGQFQAPPPGQFQSQPPGQNPYWSGQDPNTANLQLNSGFSTDYGTKYGPYTSQNDHVAPPPSYESAVQK